jgi:hypothetical protein
MSRRYATDLSWIAPLLILSVSSRNRFGFQTVSEKIHP